MLSLLFSIFSVDFVHAMLWDVSVDQFLGVFDPSLRERFKEIYLLIICLYYFST